MRGSTELKPESWADPPKGRGAGALLPSERQRRRRLPGARARALEADMLPESAEVDLLGEPRLKNGLTYYPGVHTKHGAVVLGNVVRLQLQAGALGADAAAVGAHLTRQAVRPLAERGVVEEGRLANARLERL